MTPTVLTLIGALGLGIALWIWILRPLWSGEADAFGTDPRVVALLAEREVALADLRDLDADHLDGRIAGEDHQRLRGDVLARGAEILAALDGLAADEAGGVARRAAWVEAELERMLDESSSGVGGGG